MFVCLILCLYALCCFVCLLLFCMLWVMFVCLVIWFFILFCVCKHCVVVYAMFCLIPYSSRLVCLYASWCVSMPCTVSVCLVFCVHCVVSFALWNNWMTVDINDFPCREWRVNGPSWKSPLHRNWQKQSHQVNLNRVILNATTTAPINIFLSWTVRPIIIKVGNYYLQGKETKWLILGFLPYHKGI